MLFQNRFSSCLLLSALWASLFHTTVVASEVDVERESSATFSQYNGNGLS
ncbi:MAG TPA: porin, partial [Alteromonas macleodii]|nr:porin [Alteromonas macleodii]